MKIKDIALSAAYVGQRVVKAIAVGAQEVWSAVKYIVFKDPVVEQICVANFSSDGVGVTEEDAAKVTDIGTIFKGTEIASFDELAEFVKVDKLGYGAFDGCSNLSSIDLENVVTVDRTFTNCPSLTSIGNTDKIVTIKSNAFIMCPLTGGLNLPSAKTIDWGSFSQTNINTAVLSSATSIGVGAGKAEQGVFYNCTNLTAVVLSSDISEIGNYCFFGCTNLTIVENFNNSSIKKVGISVFRYCAKLMFEELRLPYLTELSDSAFDTHGNDGAGVRKVLDLGNITYLPKINSVYLELAVVPGTVTSCANYTFSGCSNLKTLVIHATTPFPISQYFLNQTPLKSGNGTIYVPDESVEAYKTASNWSTFANIIKPLSKYVES